MPTFSRAHEIVFEKAKNKNKVFGFFALDFLEVELPGVPLVKKDIKIEEVIRKWFREIL